MSYHILMIINVMLFFLVLLRIISCETYFVSEIFFAEVKESFIMAVESTCLLIAGVLMLITIIILIIGTVIVSFCSRDEEIDYHMIPQGDWHPEHLDYDSIIDLLQSIQKSKKFQDLQDFLAQGKHLVHLNDRWEETEWSCFPFQRRKTQRITWQYGADIPNLSGLDFSIVLRQGLARFKFFFLYTVIFLCKSVTFDTIWHYSLFWGFCLVWVHMFL